MDYYKIKNAFILMRIPFSIYLMPVYWFAISCSYNIDLTSAIVVFLIIHLLAYPASNGYNSYCDKDEVSVGGLRNPPKVNMALLYLVVIFDLAAVFFSMFISFSFGLMIGLYILVSKVYSYPGIRLKKHAILGAAVIFIFQGAFTFFMVQAGLGLNFDFILSTKNILFGLVSSLFLLGSYPITQIYQHKEDAKHGDRSLSMLLGINRTFLFSGIVFGIASILLCYLYFGENKLQNIFTYLAAMIPVLFFFTRWMLKAKKNKKEINFENTMIMNKISSLSLSLAFIIMLFLN